MVGTGKHLFQGGRSQVRTKFAETSSEGIPSKTRAVARGLQSQGRRKMKTPEGLRAQSHLGVKVEALGDLRGSKPGLRSPHAGGGGIKGKIKWEGSHLLVHSGKRDAGGLADDD